jgi:single-stranded DNA-binding protein
MHGYSIGLLGHDVEAKESKDGKPYATFSIACKSYRKGEKVTTWWDIVVTGQTAKFLGDYAKKGMYVSVNGELIKEQGKDEKTYTKLLANSVELIGRVERSGDGDSGQTSKPRAAAKSAASASSVSEEDDEIPF